MADKLKIGLVGLGRLGKEYAQILQNRIGSVDLIAVCSISNEELEWAQKTFGEVNTFTSYDEMNANISLDAIVIASSTNMHARHIIKALKKGIHVFCEKPLASSINECMEVKSNADLFPHLICMIGFVRRFDESYLYAKEKIDEGLIGQPFLVKSQTVDLDDVSDFQIKYVDKSGGIFHDYNIHDIDIARWFLNSEVKNVYSMGGAYKYPDFAVKGDADNVVTTCKLENGTMAIIGASRTAMHGHDTYTEIVGTLGTLRIGRPANKNRVEIYDKSGIRQECVETFWERFEDAFTVQLREFIKCIVNKQPPKLNVLNALNNTKTATAFTTSFQTGKIVYV